MSELVHTPTLSLRIDPWASEYASALQIDEEEAEEPGVKVDPLVEMTDWAPVDPFHIAAPSSIVFVDGVQRIEARVIAEISGEVGYGAFASLAVGAVQAQVPGSASVTSVQVHRTLALAGAVEAEPVSIACGSGVLTYTPCWSIKPGYPGVADAIDSRRRDLEMQLGHAMVEAGHPLVVLDGRLRLFPTPHTAVIGYTKTIHRRYLAPPHANVLPQLQPMQRTPLFLIEEQRPLYSWYIRLAAGRRIDHPLAGLVRLETAATIGKDQAVKLANQTARCLPPFASTPERDPRAPQNLLPIGALELRLRHEMGDQAWLRRAIETYLYQTAS